ncbi:MAG: hypothetical protein KKD25_01790 [Gammaproteobacteria bacterium]|jgi:hypothetical protein|nr:hypothetical protein [Gammaproteobacteria bacterium]MBU0771779.1 hypothetical protein [Gammaproteobacteria bacterium]MBU0855535.1 hypothetical protein [Gammaproteobacteria bacterium]MBU1846097.1 hypothetical protein [Gammaproteobacteria bacterium]
MSDESGINSAAVNVEVKRFLTGTPSEIGYQLWHDFGRAVVEEVWKSAPPESVVDLYASFVSAAFGSFAADFGMDGALDLVHEVEQLITDAKASGDFSGGMTQ